VTSSPPPKQPAATLEELSAAIQGLSEPERLRLSRRGDQLAYGTCYANGLDLLDEAVLRALSGAAGSADEGKKGRVWRHGVEIVAFLMMTMKGLSSDSRGSLTTRVDRRMEALAGEDGEALSAIYESELSHESVEHTLIEREDLEARERQAEVDAALIEKRFADDDEVLAILEGEKEGWSAERIREEFGMSKLAYSTARTRLRRGLDKLMPGRRLK
jgi:hypothetical protein